MTCPGIHPKASAAHAASVAAGVLPRSRNTVQSSFWSLIKLPWKTTRPLKFLFGCPPGSSASFATQIPNRYPMCASVPAARTSRETRSHSRGSDSPQTGLSRGFCHDLCNFCHCPPHFWMLNMPLLIMNKLSAKQPCGCYK